RRRIWDAWAPSWRGGNMRTRIRDSFGIEFPIFAFSHCRDVVAAVSRAGGFGVLGALAFSPEQLEQELGWIDQHVGGKPYGVDVVMPASSAAKDGPGDKAKIGRASCRGGGDVSAGEAAG